MARAVANISSVEPDDGDGGGGGGEDVDAVDEVGVTLMKADGIKLLIGTLDTEDITGATTPRFFCTRNARASLTTPSQQQYCVV